MKTFTTKQKLILAAVIAGVSLAASVATYVLVAQKTNAVVQLRDDASRARQEDLVTLKRAIRSFGEHASLIDAVLVSKEDMFAYVDDLKRLAEGTGATVTVQDLRVIDVGNDKKEYPVDTITATQRSHSVLIMTLRLDGSWDEVMSFLLRAEQLPRQTTVDAMRLASVYNEAGTHQSWAALFELVTIIK